MKTLEEYKRELIGATIRYDSEYGFNRISKIKDIYQTLDGRFRIDFSESRRINNDGSQGSLEIDHYWIHINLKKLCEEGVTIIKKPFPKNYTGQRGGWICSS